MSATCASASRVVSSLVGAVIFLPVLPYVWTAPETATQWALLLGLGVFGGVGHWLVIIAHRYAGASVLAEEAIPATEASAEWFDAKIALAEKAHEIAAGDAKIIAAQVVSDFRFLKQTLGF